jgi:hypothetical protein
MSGEEARATRLQRLLAVQARKRQMEEWRLADLKREATALAANSVEILQSLGDQSLLQGLFLEAKASALRRNEVEIVTNQTAQGKAADRLREAQGIEKRLERASEDAGVVAARAEERTALELALDGYLTAARASFE